jgi:hypothetical protein
LQHQDGAHTPPGCGQDTINLDALTHAVEKHIFGLRRDRSADDGMGVIPSPWTGVKLRARYGLV